MKNNVLTILFILCFFVGQSQEKKSVTINWKADFSELNEDLQSVQKPYFEKAFYPKSNSFPYYIISEVVTGKVESAKLALDILKTELIKNYNGLANTENEEVTTLLKYVGDQTLIQFIIPTIVNSEAQNRKITNFNYSFTYRRSSSSANSSRTNFRSGNNSVMATGDWYKVGVTSTGIQRLSQSFFNQNGISTSSIDPRNIRVFGYSEGMLNELITGNTPSTLPEIPSYFEGENDGSFDASDYLLFFAKKADVWEWNNSSKVFYHEKHLYTDTVFYWINVGTDAATRIQSQSQTADAANKTFTTYENHQFHELENTSFIKSGRTWFGDYFDIAAGLKKNFPFTHTNKVDGEKVYLKAQFGVKSSTSSGNTITIKNGGTEIHKTSNISSVSSSYTANYVTQKTIIDSFDISGISSNLEFTYDYPTSGAVAWLDYLEVKTESNLKLGSSPLFFSQPKSVGVGNVSTFELNNTSSNTRVWDVTSPYEVYEINVDYSNNVTSFKSNTDSIKSFIAFSTSGFKTPFYVGKTSNQNLQSLVDIDYIIITSNEFKSQAEDLALFHRQNSGLSVEVVTLNKIYNEFSNGYADISGIRNFVKYLYDNASSNDTRLKYLLLFGDGNYDPLNRISNENHFIPSYQSANSISPTASYITDDFFGMLDDIGGVPSSSSTVDIGIGRFPARNSSDATGFVNKVKHYVNSVQSIGYDGQSGSDLKSTFKDWKNDVLFIADDGSSLDNYTTAHLNQTETIIDAVLNQDSTFNVNKVYLDAYNKESTAGGGRFPDVNREIRESMDKGAFFASYIGHGGEGGWADEKILDINDINAWTNIDALPVFVTATCEFSRYDDPERVSGGEYVLLNPNGGAIAMITTTRLVYGGISNNIGFSINFFEAVLNENNGEMPTLGDAIRLAKVNSPLGTNYNNRKFALLGDPAVKMAYPKYEVVTTKLNDKLLSSSCDTLKALSKIKIEGEIQLNNQLSNINGFVYPVVYDKSATSSTLDNNGIGNIVDFESRNNILYKGVATVTNGKFSFEFIVPKDINYSFGNGRISYYFANDTIDGSGYNEIITVGGSSDSSTIDETDPLVELFMNDTNFIFGGLTDENPLIYALINDENGINTTGTSLGHDISAVLDEDYSNPILLNDYYSATLNDYTSGKIVYPLNELSDGVHTLTLKVWDVNNNSGKAYTEFIVANNAKLAISHVYNYPNPFTTKTNFLFNHNKMNENLEVLVRVYTISGKLIKTIQTDVVSIGNNKSTPIEWDGLDDFGDKIGRGVYVYQLEVKSTNGETARKLEKLVILR